MILKNVYNSTAPIKRQFYAYSSAMVNEICSGNTKINSRCDQFETNHGDCLTRSEVYALLREVINWRKHHMQVDRVCDHVSDPGFAVQQNYINSILDTASLVVGDCPEKKRLLNYHSKRLTNLFNLKTTLEDEYAQAVSKYDIDPGRVVDH
ncbi:LEF-11 [Helicoverpa armigera SNPV]|nr:LEF-11 [Helicoverpa armigera SNPV]